MSRYLGKMVALGHFNFCFSIRIFKYRIIAGFGELESTLSLHILNEETSIILM